VANSPPTKDCTAAMGYCMTTDHDTRVSMSPHPPQDGRWAIFVPASYKNMTVKVKHCRLPEVEPVPGPVLLVEWASTQQGRAYSRRLHPFGAARPFFCLGGCFIAGPA
jgi:hypothetical protein